MPHLELSEATKHQILLAENLKELVGAIFADDLNELVHSLGIVINACNSSEVLQNSSKVAIQLLDSLGGHHLLDGQILEELAYLSGRFDFLAGACIARVK